MRISSANRRWRRANSLTYTDAGLLKHSLPGLRVAGLSGINAAGSNPARIPPENKTWPQIVALRKYGKISPKAFTHYRPSDVDAVLKLGQISMTLTHDWPVDPPNIRTPGLHRPEKIIVERLRPQFHFAGHHHRPASMRIGSTEFRAVNILSREDQNYASPGWAWVGRWDGQQIYEIGSWPKL